MGVGSSTEDGRRFLYITGLGALYLFWRWPFLWKEERKKGRRGGGKREEGGATSSLSTASLSDLMYVLQWCTSLPIH